MSDEIKHECGIALVRLLKPLEYYQLNYGTWKYGFQRLYLLMEKQHNRGQDGAGVVSKKLDLEPGREYLHQVKSIEPSAIDDIFRTINSFYNNHELKSDRISDPLWAKENIPFAGELLLGHLRYGTYGKNKNENVRPVIRFNNWKTRNLVLAGNFNLTNVDELFQILVDLGQHPKDHIDTVIMLENIGHFLDVENQKEFEKYKQQGYTNKYISELITQSIKIENVLKESSKRG